jgi:ferredoxin
MNDLREAERHGAVVRCGSCQRVCPIEAWRALPALMTLTASEVGGYVSRWPPDVVVEVRRCGGCGHAIARRRGAQQVSAA